MALESRIVGAVNSADSDKVAITKVELASLLNKYQAQVVKFNRMSAKEMNMAAEF